MSENASIPLSALSRYARKHHFELFLILIQRDFKVKDSFLGVWAATDYFRGMGFLKM